MDWDRAIAINQAALLRIVAALIAMAGLAVGGGMARLPRSMHSTVLGVLRPAESAVRRLIVIAARGIVAKPLPVRPMPVGLKIAAAGGRTRASFQLFDRRKRFDLRPRRAGPRPVPRIHGFGGGPLSPLFRPQTVAVAEAPPDDGMVGAASLGRRLEAIKVALDNLPAQAKRLARWQARRNRMASPKFRSPLRPGPPPGHRQEGQDDVDRVLRECHALARDALAEDSS
ncbi:hypothetical protein BH10PSE7_BH10PSE7_17990 [soil metagenome]